MFKSFFDKNYQTPDWLKEKQIIQKTLLKKMTRRGLLKSAAGTSAVTAFPSFALTNNNQQSLNKLMKSDPWRTLSATLNHLLPKSDTGPSAEDIQALTYLHQVMTIQPTQQDEKNFILKGVEWLNSFAKSEKQVLFFQLTFDEKEKLLQNISHSTAGGNWINTLLNYIFEAMLSPPSYGGNPDGVGWQWLEHQAGFPLPQKGKRFFELPKRSINSASIAIVDITAVNKNSSSKGNKKL